MDKKPPQIIQYNVHRSRDVVMAEFLRNEATQQADVIAIQEPWENPYQEATHNPTNGTHQLLYPRAREIGGERTRVCLLVTRKIALATGSM
jgi:hypothetical protein